ncbi:MAG: TetR/AcrR family transcriptional regulator [Lachnospiraceae bacterium]|nr:TetR/AcrR family transcriptional regulator [Lachnospiraceae bacterium]
MARKAVLEGGKRDEIIGTAMKLFFEHGYEATSVRMIMNEVGGEIGMFYHYFRSKDLLFDRVVEKFFKDYREKFEAMLSDCSSRQDFVKTFLPMYERSMEEFGQIQGNVHWSVQAAMHDGTLEALRPLICEMIGKWGTTNSMPHDILAGQLLYGLSATIHSPEFEKMSAAKKKKCILDYIDRILD